MRCEAVSNVIILPYIKRILLRLLLFFELLIDRIPFRFDFLIKYIVGVYGSYYSLKL